MNAAEHLAESERLLSAAQNACAKGLSANDAAGVELTTALAQVHATLALAASAQGRAGFVLSEDDVMRCAHGAVICGLCGYGVNAGDGGRS